MSGRRRRDLLVRTPRMSREKRTRWDDVDQARAGPRLAGRADRALLPAARTSRSSSRIESASGSPGSSRKSIGVAPAWSPRPCTVDVGVHIAGYRRHDPDPVPRVLQHASLLDVHLDPTREVVEDVQRLAPEVRPVAGLLRVLPEAAAIVDRAKRSRQSSSVTRWAMILLPSSICPKPEPSSSRKEISCSGRPSPSSSFSRHTSRAVTTPIVPSYLPPLRFESQ